ncbi:tRNA (Guanine37-N(1)-) methyltransferase [Thermodesulfobium acidiphilum]|uniref:tRNA (guanine-N(1)-)-methyltransferase n=1 Tax=Thermodesulfobium acidiphilum TaxID=1794699 RepID=A0A2R4W0H8_THEAF|nr:tRNA (guanosine(37)-N1)-methyltransferase TrmD [Thermodesulfobium acidiphilum]AWB10226.1 tRNA (Guanine37-N(1)-) methyltransferase [Thermodesulfobium acidiphilum]
MNSYYVLTLFPEIFNTYFSIGLAKKGLEKGLFSINIINLRDFTKDKFKKVDDYPFGGSSGLVLQVQPIVDAINYVESMCPDVIFFYPSPRGEVLKQKMLFEISKKFDKICFLCGHYKGVDERIFKLKEIKEISVGDYVLNSGEIATMVLLDGLLRLIPGFIGNEKCIMEDSISSYLLESPNYTRPREIFGKAVPNVLLSGHHKNIKFWQMKESFKKTIKSKPYLILGKSFDKSEKAAFAQAKEEILKELYSGG